MTKNDKLFICLHKPILFSKIFPSNGLYEYDMLNFKSFYWTVWYDVWNWVEYLLSYIEFNYPSPTLHSIHPCGYVNVHLLIYANYPILFLYSI